MCGRFALYSTNARIERLLEIGEGHGPTEELAPSWNVPPTEQIPAVTVAKDGERSLDLYRWGLVPSWVKELSKFKATTFNARAEDIATKATFRSAFVHRRALVPADSFYEWRKSGDKQPYVFQRVDGELMMFAGLYEFSRHREGERLRSCSIITCEGNGDISDVHSRMPLILESDLWDRWLDPSVEDPDELEGMLHPGPEGTVAHYPVSKRIGSVQHNDAELLSPDLTYEPVPTIY